MLTNDQSLVLWGYPSEDFYTIIKEIFRIILDEIVIDSICDLLIIEKCKILNCPLSLCNFSIFEHL